MDSIDRKWLREYFVLSQQIDAIARNECPAFKLEDFQGEAEL